MKASDKGKCNKCGKLFPQTILRAVDTGKEILWLCPHDMRSSTLKQLNARHGNIRLVKK